MMMMVMMLMTSAVVNNVTACKLNITCQKQTRKQVAMKIIHSTNNRHVCLKKRSIVKHGEAVVLSSS